MREKINAQTEINFQPSTLKLRLSSELSSIPRWSSPVVPVSPHPSQIRDSGSEGRFLALEGHPTDPCQSEITCSARSQLAYSTGTN